MEAGHHGGHFRTGGIAQRQDLAVVADDDALSHCPGHSLTGIEGNALRIGEVFRNIGGLGGIHSDELGVAVQDGNDLLTGDLTLRIEEAITDTVDDLVLGGPVHSCGVPGVGGAVGEGNGVDVVELRLTCSSPDNADQFYTAHGGVGVEDHGGSAAEEAGLDHVINIRSEPGIVGNVDEAQVIDGLSAAVDADIGDGAVLGNLLLVVMAGGLGVLNGLGLAALTFHGLVTLGVAGGGNVFQNGELVHQAGLCIEVIQIGADGHPLGDIVAADEVHLLAGLQIGSPAGVILGSGLFTLLGDADEGIVGTVIDVLMLDDGIVGIVGIIGINNLLGDLLGEAVQLGAVGVVGGDGQLLLGGLSHEIDGVILLSDLCKVELGVVHGDVVHISGLLAQVAADEVGGAVFHNHAALQLLGTGIGVVVTVEDNVNTGCLKGGGQDLLIAEIAGGFIGEVDGLVDGDQLPGAFGSGGILLDPGSNLFQVRAVVDHSQIHIAVLHGVVVGVGDCEDLLGNGTGRSTVVLVVAECAVEQLVANAAVLQDVQDLCVVVVVVAVVDEVTGLDTEVYIILSDQSQNGIDLIDGILVLCGIAGHLGVAQNVEHRSFIVSGLGGKGHSLRPGFLAAVAQPVVVGGFGGQTVQGDGVQVSSIAGGGKGNHCGLATDGEIVGVGAKALGQLLILLFGHVADVGLLSGVVGIGEPGDGGHGAVVFHDVVADGIGQVVLVAGIAKNLGLGLEGQTQLALGGDDELGTDFHGSHGIGGQSAVFGSGADLGAVELHGDIGSGQTLDVIDSDGAVSAVNHGADGYVVVGNHGQNGVAVSIGAHSAVHIGEGDVADTVLQVVHLGVNGGGNIEADRCHSAGETCLSGDRQGQSALLVAGGEELIFAGDTLCEGDDGSAVDAAACAGGGSTEVGIDVNDGHFDLVDSAFHGEIHDINAAQGDDAVAAEGDIGILSAFHSHVELTGHGNGVAVAVGDSDGNGMVAVAQGGTGHGLAVVAVAGDVLAVDEDGGGSGVNAGAVLALGIVECGLDLHVSLGDDGGAIGCQFHAVDGEGVDDGVDQIIQVGAVDEAHIVKIQGAVEAAFTCGGLIGQPYQALALTDHERMLGGDGGVESGQICIAVHPTGPVDAAGLLALGGIEQGDVLGGVAIAVPHSNVHIDLVSGGAFGSIDPNANLSGITLNRDLLAAVADIEVGVGAVVEGGVVVVQLQSVVAGTNLAALFSADGAQSAGIVGLDGVVGPQIVGVAVGTEDGSSGNCGVVVAGELIGSGQGGDGGAAGVSAGGDDIQGGIFTVVAVAIGAALVVVGILAPVIVCSGERAVLIGLEVLIDHGHLTDLHMDHIGEGSAVQLGVGHGHISGDSAFKLAGVEDIAVHGAHGGILHTFGGGLDLPGEVAILIVDDALEVLGIQTQVGACVKVQGDGLAGKVQIVNIGDGDLGAAVVGSALHQADLHLTGKALLCGEHAVGGDVAALGGYGPGQTLGDLGRLAGGVNADGGELHGAAGGVDFVLGVERSVVEAAVGDGGRDHQQSGSNGTLGAVGGRVTNDHFLGAFTDGGIGGRAAAV